MGWQVEEGAGMGWVLELLWKGRKSSEIEVGVLEGNLLHSLAQWKPSVSRVEPF